MGANGTHASGVFAVSVPERDADLVLGEGHFHVDVFERTGERAAWAGDRHDACFDLELDALRDNDGLSARDDLHPGKINETTDGVDIDNH